MSSSSSRTKKARVTPAKSTKKVPAKQVEPAEEPEEFTADWAIGLDTMTLRRIANLQMSLGQAISIYGTHMRGLGRTTRKYYTRGEMCKDGKSYMAKQRARDAIREQMENIAACEAMLKRCREVLLMEKTEYCEVIGANSVDWVATSPDGNHPESIVLALEHPQYQCMVDEFFKWCPITTDPTSKNALSRPNCEHLTGLWQCLQISEMFKAHLDSIDPAFSALIDKGHIYSMLQIIGRWNASGDMLVEKDDDDDD